MSQKPIQLIRDGDQLGYTTIDGNFVPVQLPKDHNAQIIESAPLTGEIIDDAPVVYETPKFPKRAYNLNIFYKGKSYPLKTGQRFTARDLEDGSTKTYVYIAAMQAFRQSRFHDGSEFKQYAFFVNEGKLQPFHMPLSEFIAHFEHGYFVLVAGTADLGNSYHGADTTFT